MSRSAENGSGAKSGLLSVLQIKFYPNLHLSFLFLIEPYIIRAVMFMMERQSLEAVKDVLRISR